jgi:hypothetical protein
MKVRAKMVVTGITENRSLTGEVQSRFVQLTPVCDEQNKSWAKYTPCGKVELSLDEPAMPAFEAFQKGTFFFVDFTPAPAAEKDEAHPIG